MLTRSFKIGMNAGHIVTPVIHVNQYDHDEQWIFTLVDDNGVVYTPSTGGIVGLKADGNVILNAGTVNSSGQVVINETQQMTAAPGDATYELLLDNSTHGCANFTVRVEPKPGDNATYSDSDLSLLQEAIDSTIPANIEAAVQDWMDDNLAPSQWVIDNTLSIAGAAADAKKTGDGLNELKTELRTQTGAIEGNFLNTSNILNAYINDDGKIVSNPNNKVTWSELAPNTKYRLTIQHKSNTDCVLILCDTIPANGVTGIGRVRFISSATSVDYLFTTDSTHVYVAFKYWANGATPYTADEVLASTTISMENTVSDRINEVSEIVDYSLAQHPTGAYLTTGGNLVPNNRIMYNRVKVSAGDIIFMYPDKSTASVAVQLITEVFTSETGGTKLETSEWQSSIYEHIVQHDGYAELIVSPVNSADSFNNANSCDNCFAYYEKNALVNIKKSIGDTHTYELLSARHVASENPVSPLTLLHFSDIHKDTAALGRIMEDATKYAENIDGYICTGDMVPGTYEQITAWWNPVVMTCIGNHDTASYNSSTGYNWTALSMADRDAYYISPFKSNWGITHTSGKSYYYKDYSSQKVRLIVMDVMLYNDNGAEATAQTTWLSNLLSSAITNNLHVIIAVHAPHFDSVALESSFTRVGQTPMPYESDCTTPDVVIETVAAAITNGLHFIGYICGHTHQDNIWKATEDGSQLMYCITCAIVSQYAQWKKSDMHRSVSADAYNLVTIDTEHTLVKLVRGGGADLDDHMRTRKAICFNYSTGTVVGQIL